MRRILNFITKASIYLLAFLVPLAIFPWASEVFEFPKQYILFFLAVAGFIAWLAKMILVDKDVKLVRTQLDKVIFLFFAVAAVSSVFSEDKVASLLGSYGRFSGGLIGMASLVLFYALLVNHAAGDAQKNPQKIPASRLLKVFTCSIAIVVAVWYASFLQIGERLSSLPSVFFRQGLNLGGGSQEGLAVFLAAFLPFFISRLSIRNVFRVSGLWSATFLLSSFVVLLAVDFSRAWVVFILGLLLLLFLRIWQRVRVSERISVKRLLPILVFMFIAFVSLFKPVEFSLLFPEISKEPVLSQDVSWGIAIDNAKEGAKNALLGSGPATFGISFAEHKPASLNETVMWRARLDRAGSHIAETLSTLGLPGLVVWIALAGLFFAVSGISILYLVTRKEKVNPAYEETNTAFLVLVFGLFISQFFYYQTTLLSFSFWLALALGVVAFEQGMKELSISLRKYLEIALAFRLLLLALLLLLGFSYFFGARIYLADIKYAQALRQTASPAGASSQAGLMSKAIELNPWQGEYRLYLSRLFFARAREALLLPVEQQDKAAISLDVQKAIAYVRGDTVGGKRIQGAVEVEPKSVAAWEQLGFLYQEINFAPGAAEWGIKAYEKAIELEPANPVLYNELAKAYGAREDFERARERVEKAIALKPDFLEAQSQSALLYEKQGDTAAARKLLESLIVKYPTDAELLFQLGRLYYNVKEVERAILQFEEAVRLAPNHSNAHYSLGVAYEDAGKKKEAIVEFEKVLDLNPGNEEVARRLEKLQERI